MRNRQNAMRGYPEGTRLMDGSIWQDGRRVVAAAGSPEAKVETALVTMSGNVPAGRDPRSIPAEVLLAEGFEPALAKAVRLKCLDCATTAQNVAECHLTHYHDLLSLRSLADLQCRRGGICLGSGRRDLCPACFRLTPIGVRIGAHPFTGWQPLGGHDAPTHRDATMTDRASDSLRLVSLDAMIARAKAACERYGQAAAMQGLRPLAAKGRWRRWRTG